MRTLTIILVFFVFLGALFGITSCRDREKRLGDSVLSAEEKAYEAYDSLLIGDRFESVVEKMNSQPINDISELRSAHGMREVYFFPNFSGCEGFGEFLCLFDENSKLLFKFAPKRDSYEERQKILLRLSSEHLKKIHLGQGGGKAGQGKAEGVSSIR